MTDSIIYNGEVTLDVFSKKKEKIRVNSKMPTGN